MARKALRVIARACAARAARAAAGLGLAVAVTLCAQACGETAANPVAPMSPITRVYAFEPGLIYAYQVDANGHVSGVGSARFRVADRKWNRVVADRGGRFLFVTVEDEGEIWVYALDPTTGMPSLVPGSPFTTRTPHGLHAAVVAPLSPHLYVAGEPPGNVRGDVTAFRIDPVAGTLSEIAGSPFRAGFAPFRIWADPTGQFVYAANNGSSDPWRKRCLSAYRADPTQGTLVEAPGSCYETKGFVGNAQFHPSGRFLYATAEVYFLAYRIGADGALAELPLPNEPVGLPVGAYVRALSVTADGRFLHAVQDSGWVITYRIDADSGALSFMGETRGAQGFSAATFHRSAPLAVILGREALALNVERIDEGRGLLLAASAPVTLASGLSPHESGATVFFDASGQVLCVVVDDSRQPPQVGVRLLTYRLRADASLEGPVEESAIGEGREPVIAVVRSGMSLQPGSGNAASP